MYYIRFDDSANYRWQPWDAVIFTANCTARVALLASTQPQGNMTQLLFGHFAPNVTPVLYSPDQPQFDDWIIKYWRDTKDRVLTLDLPAGQLFLPDIRRRLNDLITAVTEKEDRLVLFSDEIDGLSYAGKEIKPTRFESLLFLGMRPSRKGFFEGKPVDRYHFVPRLAYSCGEEIIALRSAFAEIDMETVKTLMREYSFSDMSTGGLIATALYAIMLNGGFTGRAVPKIEELLRFLIEENGADVNYRLEEDGGSVLHLLGVSFGNHTNTAVLIQILKRFGADLFLKNDRGDIPFLATRNHLLYNTNVITALKPGETDKPNGGQRRERFPYDF